MKIKRDLKKYREHGDWSAIANLFNKVHSKTDGKTVTPVYVMYVVNGIRKSNPGTAAEEVISIAAKFLKARQRLSRELTN